MKRIIKVLIGVLLFMSSAEAQDIITRENKKSGSPAQTVNTKKKNSNNKEGAASSTSKGAVKSSTKKTSAKNSPTLIDKNEEKTQSKQIYDDGYDLYRRIADTWDENSYDNFLKRYPGSPYASDIRARKNEIGLWRSAHFLNSIAGYEDYINNSDLLHFEDMARENIRKLQQQKNLEITDAWERACRDNTVEAYDRFLDKYPDSEYAVEAGKKKVDCLASEVWRRIKDSYNLEKYENFVASYPGSSYVAEAKNLILAEKGLAEANNGNYITAYNYFSDIKSDAPLLSNNRYSEAYYQAKHEYLYKGLNKNSSTASLKNFLNEYPSSPYEANVKNYLALAMATSFGIYTSEHDYALVTEYATGEYEKMVVAEKIKENRKKQKEHSKYLKKQKNAANSADNYKKNQEDGRMVQFGWEILNFAYNCTHRNEYGDNPLHFDMGVRVKYGRFNNRLQFSAGVGIGFTTSEGYYPYEDEDEDIDTILEIPLDAQVKLNLFKVWDRRWLFISGGLKYNICTHGVPNQIFWNAGLGVTTKHWDWTLYCQKEMGHKVPNDGSYRPGSRNEKRNAFFFGFSSTVYF